MAKPKKAKEDAKAETEKKFAELFSEMCDEDCFPDSAGYERAAALKMKRRKWPQDMQKEFAGPYVDRRRRQCQAQVQEREDLMAAERAEFQARLDAAGLEQTADGKIVKRGGECKVAVETRSTERLEGCDEPVGFFSVTTAEPARLTPFR